MATGRGVSATRSASLPGVVKSRGPKNSKPAPDAGREGIVSAAALRTDFRPEIEGLRALAAGLVAVCHIWVGGVSGGVDVFFVVSGFLVTKSVLSQRQRRGGINPFAFWANLLKRLLPAAFLVIGTVCVAAILVFPTFLWVNTIRHAVASLFYFENWRLAFDAIDYLRQGLEATPFRHYWALSVQGQFYFTWPLLMLLLLWRAPVQGDAGMRRLRWAFALIFVASLCYSVIATRRDQPFAYYDSAARIWEFAMGALLALWIARIRIGRAASFLLGWAGLAGLLACAFVFDISDRFPGYVALLPTLSAMAVIVAGGTRVAGGAPTLLGTRALVWLGGISYAFYLWHWPILVLYRQFQYDTAVSLPAGLLIILVSLALSAATTRWVENPIRYSTLGGDRPVWTFAAMAALTVPVLAIVGGWGIYTKTLTSAVAPLDLEDPRYPGARAVGIPRDEVPEAELYPRPINVHLDLPRPYGDDCHQDHDDPELLRCVYGDPEADTTIAVVGGSHSVQWLPSFEVFAKRDGYRIASYTKSFCLFSSPAGFGEVYPYPSCTEWNRRLLRELIETRPALVVTTATRDGGPGEYVPESFLERFRRLGEHGIPVLAIRDNPWFPFEPSKCVDAHGRDAARCAVPRGQLLASDDPTQRLEDPPDNVRFADFSRFFCDRERCFPVMGNVLVYRDSHHITPSYMRTLSGYLRDEVRAAMGDGGDAAAASPDAMATSAAHPLSFTPRSDPNTAQQ